ncbi:MAG: hypothetical protein PHO30_01755 [Candidatus Omnitrophica bacterium]|nr:hypothetical protein [Candidatus Omnitrophota bacterium]
MTKIVYKDENLWMRVLITLAIVFCARMLYFFPVPGVDLKALFGLYQRHIHTQGGGWLDLIQLLHVGRLRNISICALGIMPFINACIIVQIIGFLVPGVNRVFFHERNGRQQMMFMTLAVTIIIGAMHAYGSSLDLELMDKFPRFQILYFTGIPFRIAAVCSMIAAVLLLVVLAEAINQFGIGNGVGVLFISEALMRLFFAVDQVTVFYERNLVQIQQLMLVIGVLFAFVYFARFVTRFREEIKFSTPENEIFFISVKPFWTGVWPLILAEIAFSFTTVSLNLVSFAAVCLTVIFFSLLYVKIIYQPRRFYELLLSHHCRVCEPQEKSIEDHLNQAVVRGVVLSSMLFITMYYVPVLLPLLSNVSFMSAGIFGAFGIILPIGLYYDIARQVKFYKKLSILPVKKWRLLNIAQEEAEAEVKKACLRGHGILTEIRPSHFSWGLPVRTVASGYALYVPIDNITEAIHILEELRTTWREKAL